MLLPMYFLIGIWGGPRREYAAIKFFLYTLFGSVFILIALLAFYFTDVQDFVHPDVIKAARSELETRNAEAYKRRFQAEQKGKATRNSTRLRPKPKAEDPDVPAAKTPEKAAARNMPCRNSKFTASI